MPVSVRIVENAAPTATTSMEGEGHNTVEGNARDKEAWSEVSNSEDSGNEADTNESYFMSVSTMQWEWE